MISLNQSTTQSTTPPPIEQTTAQLFTLYDMRERSGFTGPLAAEICQISYQSIRNWETGKKIPNVINLLELLKVYGYTIDQLDLTPFYTKVNKSSDKKEKHTQTEKADKHAALNRLKEMRKQYTPDAT